MRGVHNAVPLPRLITLTFLLALCVDPTVTGFGAGQEVSQLRTQLEAAKDAADKPAIVELSRRILAITPNDSGVWEHLHKLNWKLKTGIDSSKRSMHGKTQYGIQRRRLKISAAPCALDARIIRMPSGIGLPSWRRSRGRQMPRPSTIIWRIYVRTSSAGKITRIIEQRELPPRIPPRGVSRAQLLSFVCTNGTRLMPTWRRQAKWMPPTRK